MYYAQGLRAASFPSGATSSPNSRRGFLHTTACSVDPNMADPFAEEGALNDATPDEAADADPVEMQVASFFVEADEVVALIQSLDDPAAKHEAAAERVAQVLDHYQEQPSILDSKLEAMVTPLLEAVRGVSRGTRPKAVLPHACRVFYSLCKVRGYKTIVKFVPHEVADLEPLVHLLAGVGPADATNWQIAYALMVWLSMVVMVPFDLSIIDSTVPLAANAAAAGSTEAAQAAASTEAAQAAASTEARGGRPLVEAIEKLAMSYLGSTGPARDGAAICLARLLTRPGLQRQLSAFITWAGAELSSGRAAAEAAGGAGLATSLMVGIYTAVATIFKLGHRTELLPMLPLLGPLTASPEALLTDPSVIRRKLGIKLLQRVAAVYLPPRVAAWRYQRGSRSLEKNLQLTAAPGTDTSAATAAAAAAADVAVDDEEEGEEEEAEVPEAIEEIIEQLLRGLGDGDTVVRWSAAKGIGRVTARLPLDMADDIVESVLEVLSDKEDANAWHGGCLALAELARRGLLLPARLPQVLPRIVSALHFDVPRGATSVGTHVRDAACYVCWAFARAFEPSVMQPHVEPLAKALLIVVVFDREVNCRRAAAAAFQENVGRQGNFPHGIDIVTKADYFSVGSRPNAYLTIGTYLGGFDAYRGPLLDHLATVKFKHWDPHIRLLAAQAAACLAPLDAPYVLDTLFPTLYDKTLSPDLKARHGATHMIAEALLGLARACYGGEGRLLPDATRKAVSGLVPAIEKARLYRGRGGEVMRGATARLLEVCALLRLPSGPKASKEKLVSLDDSIKHPHEPISHAAVAGLQAVAAAYFSAPAPGTTLLEPLVDRYAAPLLSDPNAGLRRGYSLALGALPRPQLAIGLATAVRALVKASQMEALVEARDPETRRNAIKALLQVATTSGLTAFTPEPTPESKDAGAGEGEAAGEAAADGHATPADEAKLAAAADGAPQASTLPPPPPPPRAVGMSAALYVEAVTAMLEALGDYQTDNRGDVGSWVREAAIASLLPMLLLGCPTPGAPPLAEREAESIALAAAMPRLTARYVELLTQLSNEKIDQLRELAALTLIRLLEHKELPPVPQHADLAAILLKAAAVPTAAAVPATARADSSSAAAVAEAAMSTSIYLAPHECFPRTAQLLSCAAYRKATLRGLSVSAGGITESTTKAAAGALMKQVSAMSASERSAFGSELVALLLEHASTARLQLPLMRTAVLLVESRLLEGALAAHGASLASELLVAIQPASRSKDVPTLLVALQLLVLLLPHTSGPRRTEVVRTLVLLLAHRFPKVRKATADQFYVHLLTYGDPGELEPMPVDDGAPPPADGEPPLPAAMPAGEPRLELLQGVLLETAWLGDLDKDAKPARTKLLEALGLPPPRVVAGAAPAKPKADEKAFLDYKELVGEVGY